MAEIALALQNKEEIIRLFGEGQKLAVIAKRFHLPVAAVEYVLKGNDSLPDSLPLFPTEPAPAAPGPSPNPAPGPAATLPPAPTVDPRMPKPGVVTGAKAVSPTSHQANVKEPQQMVSDPGATNTGPGGYTPAQGYAPATGIMQGADPLPSLPLTGGGAGPGQPYSLSPMGERFQITSLYDNLFTMMREVGLNEGFSNFVIRRFRYYPPNNTSMLNRILVDGGVNKQTIDSILGAWGELLKARDSGVVVDSSTTLTEEERWKRLNERLKGGATVGPPGSLEEAERKVAQLDAMERELALKERERLLEERKKALSHPDPANTEEEYMQIMVKSGGPTPTMMKIKKSEYPMWAPYIAKAGEESNGPPEWFRPYAERIAQEEAAKAEQSRMEALMGPVFQKLAALEAKIGTGAETNSPMAHEIAQLRESLHQQEVARERDRAEAAQQRMAQLEARLHKATTIEGQAEIRKEMENVMRTAGWVPAGEKERLDKETVALEAERQANLNKTKVQAELGSVATKKIESIGEVKRELVKSGIVKEGMDLAREMLLPENDRKHKPGGGPDERTLDDATRAMEKAMQPQGGG